MKINKRNPAHWLYLARFAAVVLAARIGRRWVTRPRRNIVVLYGHKLSGNLLAIYRYAQRSDAGGLQFVFLSLDPVYHRQLVAQGVSSCSAMTFAGMKLLLNARAIISDHGLHAMEYLLGARDLKFYDVWHGIPFKGFDADDFRVQHRYDATWVASPMLADMYVNKFGFNSKRVRTTGYARTDMLVNQDADISELRRDFGLPEQGKIVLFAPTWAQDVQGRSLFPFGLSEAEFLQQLSSTLERCGAFLVLRTHLNSVAVGGKSALGVARLPYAQYPDTEALLMVSDVLICDWSSIAFDFLLLNRPTLFLNVQPPFTKGFSMGGQYRFGPVIRSMEELKVHLTRGLSADMSESVHESRRAEIRAQLYGSFADGRSAERCMRELAADLCDITPPKQCK